MKTAILVDSACSLPGVLCAKYHITKVPLKYFIDEEPFVDSGDDDSNEALFASGVFGRKHDVHTMPPEQKDFERAIIVKIKQGYQNIVVQTVNRTQGETYNQANAAVARVRQQLDGRKINLRVMDSRTVFAGQGLMAVETVRRQARGVDDNQLRREMDYVSSSIHTYIIPKDPLVALERSRERNENSVGWAQALIASKLGIHPIICNVNDASHAVTKLWGFKKAAEAVFKHAITCINRGLVSPIITINYCGPMTELRAMPSFDRLQTLCREKKLMLVPSLGSVAAGIYTSVGSLSLALACEAAEWGETKPRTKKDKSSG